MTPTPTAREGATGRTTEATHYVLGGGRVGATIAERLRAAGRRVAVVDESHGPDDGPGIEGDPADPRALADAGLEGASAVVVAARSDRRTLLVAGIVRANFDVGRIVPLVDDPDRVPVFADAGLEPLCATSALSDAIVEAV